MCLRSEARASHDLFFSLENIIFNYASGQLFACLVALEVRLSRVNGCGRSYFLFLPGALLKGRPGVAVTAE